MTDSAEIEVRTEIQDLIRIEGLDELLVISGTDNTDWTGSTEFKVKRQGANANTRLSYQLLLESNTQGNAQEFFLVDGENILPINIAYTTDDKEGLLRYGEWSTELLTDQGFTEDQQDDDNLALTFVVKKNTIVSARAGAYESVVTVMVRAR
ncbi:hypothetical protein [Parendozoicomonas haliclonae]|uniref:hypothetical protein n=1 Tax=Parendozoicomonas haliclonae TaxID=1960125 RepID=UPI001055B750|nr:hypothetical protein [Parendozoicomonas haliclonae]